MMRDFFPSLIVRGKWYVQRRNVMVGDVVIAQDSNVVRSEWKIARVSKAFPDSKGIVRNCEVQYKRLNKDGCENKFTTVSRPVQRLVVLVPIDENYD